MVGVIILTHGLFGEELHIAAEMIIGKQSKVEILSMLPNNSLKEVTSQLESLIEKYMASGVVVFTDMFGGSPSNISMAYLQNDAVEVVSGVNLPMLVKAYTMRMDKKVKPNQIAVESAQAGLENIKVASALLSMGK